MEKNHKLKRLEKKGNFMLFIKHLYNNKKYDFSHDPDVSGAEACAEFVKNNIHNQIGHEFWHIIVKAVYCQFLIRLFCVIINQ